jgi:HK97 gp10 family phage protein
MAGEVQVRIEGLNKLTRALRKSGVEVKDMKAANARVANVVVRHAQPITPHDTGALAGSIRPAQRQSGAIVRAGGGKIRYAKFVEYGTSKMRARPYLYRAAEEAQPQWVAVYEAELEQLMNQVAATADGTGP